MGEVKWGIISGLLGAGCVYGILSLILYLTWSVSPALIVTGVPLTLVGGGLFFGWVFAFQLDNLPSSSLMIKGIVLGLIFGSLLAAIIFLLPIPFVKLQLMVLVFVFFLADGALTGKFLKMI